MPSTMCAVQMDSYGGPETLHVRTVGIPPVGPRQVLVRVHAAGLNPKDARLRAAAPAPWVRASFPCGTGFDFAGEVAATGELVTDLEPAQHVWGFLDGHRGGTAAEYVAVPRGWLSPMPARAGWAEGAAIPLVACAALQALRDVARLSAGERLLVKGASGGVGSAAIQIARSIGAHVTAFAAGAGLEYVRALGADDVVDYSRTDPASLAGPFDVFLDCAGGSGCRAYRRLLTRRGRWVTVAPNLALFVLAPLWPAFGLVVGGPRPAFVMVRPRRADLEEIGRLVERGQLRMPVTGSYALDEIRAAHHALSSGGVLGKRVLLVSEEAMLSATRRPGPAQRRLLRIAG
ncbi:MAG: NAD(P)-dependent alcohol dehydrogenase [Gemmatimonadaceae bacterium]